MNPEEEAYLLEQETKARNSETQRDLSNINQSQQAMWLEEAEKGMVQEQLSLEDEKEEIAFLLRGYTQVKDEYGNKKWVAPTDTRMILFTEYGIQLILNAISFYINKNTLLSNYDGPTILGKMEDFADSLNDTLFILYDQVFAKPTLEDCKKVLNESIADKVKSKKYSYELTGRKDTEEEIRKAVIKEIEPHLEKEIGKIREQLMKDKLKRYDLCMRCVQDAVHSTYNRAFNGGERRSIRQHMHISEINSTTPRMQMGKQQGGVAGWFRR